jgi:predicted N-acyltransferase
MTKTLEVRTIHRIREVDAALWNALTDGRYPHLRHEFLRAMEEFGCLGEAVGWLPCHLIFEDAGRLAAAMPMYLKFNSFGEFVFDWSWANAYERAGLDYYPKLVIASPFTPALGPRVLTAPTYHDDAANCIEAAIAYARAIGVSSCHWLFATDLALLHSPQVLVRQGYQFHWHNRGYDDFEHFLSFLSSKRRKQIRKERREVRAAGVTLRRLCGNELSDEEWGVFYRLYRNTFDRYGNYPAMTAEFFRELGRSMGERVLMVFAERRGEIVAGAFCLIGTDTLYGRYWGCLEYIPSLHFEVCYYQGLEYAIEHGLQCFEPGAQGEHKVSRGFLPAPTWSLHWIADSDFRRAIAHFLEGEKAMVEKYMEELSRQTPFRSDAAG